MASKDAYLPRSWQQGDRLADCHSSPRCSDSRDEALHDQNHSHCCPHILHTVLPLASLQNTTFYKTSSTRSNKNLKTQKKRIKMLKRREEYDTYLTTSARHYWSKRELLTSFPLSLFLFLSAFLFHLRWTFLPSKFESTSSADEDRSAGWKLQLFIYFHRHLSAPAMSTDNNQVGVAICPSL